MPPDDVYMADNQDSPQLIDELSATDGTAPAPRRYPRYVYREGRDYGGRFRSKLPEGAE